MRYSLGIDLGATTCAAALQRGTHVEPCGLGEISTTMPAVALPRADGSTLVGEAAEHVCHYEPTLVARSVAGQLADAGPVVVDDQVVDPVALTEALIGTIIDRTSTTPGGHPDQIVLTYPLRQAGIVEPVLESAAGRASASPTVLVPEPIAAMAKLSHDVELALGTTVAVVDFGGSSLDVTLVRRTDSGFDLVGEPASLPDFGGVDVDTAVLSHVEAAIGDVTSRIGPDDPGGMAALRRLRTSCRLAKELLSAEPEAVVDVAMPHARAHVAITRDDLEHLIVDRLTEAVDLVAATIDGAGLGRADVHVALVVGGSARIPLLSQLIADRVGLPIVADPLPELTVALGAALFGGQPAAGDLPRRSEAAHGAPGDPLGQTMVGALPLEPPVPDPGPAPLLEPPAWEPTAAAAALPDDPDAWDPTAAPAPLPDPDAWDPTVAAGDNGWDPAVAAGDTGWDPTAAPADTGWDPAAAPAAAGDTGWDQPGGDWAGEDGGRPWEDTRTSVFDDMPVAAMEHAIGHPPDRADEEFRQLKTSDTDPFGTRASSLSGRLERHAAGGDDEDGAGEGGRRGFGKRFGDSTDSRVVLGAIGAGLAIVLLGGFAVVAATGGGGDGDISVGSAPASTTSTSTTAPTTTTTAPSTTASTAAPRTTTTTGRSTTTTTRPRATTTTTPPPIEPVPTTPSTEPTTTSPPPTDPPPTTTPPTSDTTPPPP